MADDPDFGTAITRVAIFGGAIGVIAAGILFIAYRAFSPGPKGNRDFRAVVLIGAVLAFVMLACVVLLAISLRGRH